jgi:predicted O-methyltransferase YrrM
MSKNTPPQKPPHMTQDDKWNAIDDFIVETFLEEDPALEVAQAACDAAGLPKIQVAPLQGKLLMMLARALQARSILEVGTLGGYSTIWLARGLAEGGRVTTLELDPRHAEIAERNFENAGLADCVTVRVGSALESMAALHSESVGPFDLVFIDADKPSTHRRGQRRARGRDPRRTKRQQAHQRLARILCMRGGRSARDRDRVSDRGA